MTPDNRHVRPPSEKEHTVMRTIAPASLLWLTISFILAQTFGAVVTAANAQTLPAKQADLDARMHYWGTKLPFCNWNFGPKFPSKYDDATGADTEAQKCNDGDSVALNGLLCAVGDDRGCDAVRGSQGTDGRWWRSPKKLHEKPPEGSETTFSNDHALGVWAYIAQKKDRDAFKNWIGWMDRNPRCGLTFNCLPGQPRYCQDDRCTFKFIDCPLIDRLALILLKANPICDPSHNLANALLHIIELQQQFDDSLSSLYRIPGAKILKPEIELLRKPFDASLKLLKEATLTAEDLRGRADTFMRATTESAGLVALINAMVNEPGYSLHDVAAAVFLLKKYGGFNGNEVSTAAEILQTRENQNAFFEFVAHGPSERMLDEILAKCPSQSSDVPHARFQWIWERADNENPPPWKKTMYWDCLFVGQLYKNGPLSGINIPAPPLVGDAYVAAMHAVADAEWAVNEVLRLVQELVKDAKDPGKKLAQLVHNAGKAMEKAVHDAGKTANKAAEDIRNTINKAAQDTGRALDKGVRDGANTAAKAAADAQKTVDKGAEDAKNATVKAATDVANTAAKAATDTTNTAKKAVNDVGNTLRHLSPF
jgi:hypothetical protein